MAFHSRSRILLLCTVHMHRSKALSVAFSRNRRRIQGNEQIASRGLHSLQINNRHRHQLLTNFNSHSIQPNKLISMNNKQNNKRTTHKGSFQCLMCLMFSFASTLEKKKRSPGCINSFAHLAQLDFHLFWFRSTSRRTLAPPPSQPANVHEKCFGLCSAKWTRIEFCGWQINNSFIIFSNWYF